MDATARCMRLTVVIGAFGVIAPDDRSSRLRANEPPAPSNRYEQSQTHMGTRFTIALYATNEATASRAATAAFRRIGRLDAMLSDYRDDSELTLLSRASGGPAQRVGDDLFEVLSRAQEWSRRTEGAFDVTIGPVVRQWRRARRLKRLPTQRQIESALARSGYRKLRLNGESRTAELLQPGMLLDLGGIAKGYACDRALDVLKEHGIDAALVDGGGDVSMSGPPPGKEGWTIRLASADSTPGADPPNLLLSDRAVATSGDTEQFVEFDGVRYSHIVDPRTGLGLTDRVQVTVIAANGADADALASALSVMGPRRGIALIDHIPESACRITRETAHGIERFVSCRWPDLGDGR